MNSWSDISPVAILNSACLTDPKPQTWPSMATLYGGSREHQLDALVAEQKRLVGLFFECAATKKAVRPKLPEVADGADGRAPCGPAQALLLLRTASCCRHRLEAVDDRRCRSR